MPQILKNVDFNIALKHAINGKCYKGQDFLIVNHNFFWWDGWWGRGQGASHPNVYT